MMMMVKIGVAVLLFEQVFQNYLVILSFPDSADRTVCVCSQDLVHPP